MSEAAEEDVMDRLAGLSNGGSLYSLRRQRPDVVRYTQASYDALLQPNDDAGVTHGERAALALAIANTLGQSNLVDHYRALLAERDPEGRLLSVLEKGEADARFATILEHVKRLTADPAASEPGHLRKLSEAGLTGRAIVAVSQLTAFVNYQARVLAGLLMLRGH